MARLKNALPGGSRLVIEGLRGALGDEGLSRAAVTKGAISQARSQVGAAPLKSLYQEQVRPVGPADMAGMTYRGYRLMAIDGSTLDMPDEADNVRRFGYPGVTRVVENPRRYTIFGMPVISFHRRIYRKSPDTTS